MSAVRFRPWALPFMRALITGGTGFLGGATARRLKSQGHDVAVLGRNPKAGERLKSEGIEFFPIDISRAKAGEMDAAFQNRDVVVHCAALASPWGNYQDFYAANVTGTTQVVDAAVRNGVKRFVNISTPSLYFDYQHRLGIKESDPLPQKQVTSYGATKKIADEIVNKAMESGLEVIHLRPRAIFGPGDQTVLGRVIRLAEKGTVPLIGGGKSFVDMTYIDNAVDAIVLAMNAPASLSGRTYNITNGEPKRSRDMMKLLTEKLGWKVRYRHIPFFAGYAMAWLAEKYYLATKRKDEPPLTLYAVGLMGKSQTLDINAAKKDLGYEPKVSLEKGMEIYAKWWKDTVSRAPVAGAR